MNVVMLSNMPWSHPSLTNRQSWAYALTEIEPSSQVVYLNLLGWAPRRPAISVTRGAGEARIFAADAWNPFPWAGKPRHRSRRLVNREFWIRALRNVVREKMGISTVDLLVIFDPLVELPLPGLSADLTVYDRLDFYAEQPQYSDPRDKAEVGAAEARLAAQVDLVSASAPALAVGISSRSAPAVCVPGTLPRPQWATVSARRPTMSDTYEGRLTGVFVGALDPYKTDISYFERLLNAVPSLHLKIVGGSEFSNRTATEALIRLQDLGRLTLLGSRPRNALGPILEAADFGIVAMTKSRYSQGSFPLKYWDYQWAGLPTLAINAPALRGMPGVLSCDDLEDLGDQTIHELLELGHRADEWVDHAAANDAVNRVQQILEYAKQAVSTPR